MKSFKSQKFFIRKQSANLVIYDNVYLQNPLWKAFNLKAGQAVVYKITEKVVTFADTLETDTKITKYAFI